MVREAEQSDLDAILELCSVWLCNSQSRYKGKRVRKRTASAWNRICKGTSQRQKDVNAMVMKWNNQELA